MLYRRSSWPRGAIERNQCQITILTADGFLDTRARESLSKQSQKVINYSVRPRCDEMSINLFVYSFFPKICSSEKRLYFTVLNKHRVSFSGNDQLLNCCTFIFDFIFVKRKSKSIVIIIMMLI